MTTKTMKNGGLAMLDDFFVRALLAAVGIAMVAGPLGCFIVWRRMSYFGDTLAHSALLGVALGILLETDPVWAVLAVCTAVSAILLVLAKRGSFSSDAILGILSHSALALGLVSLGFITWVRVDLTSLLFGDILSVTRSDLAVVCLGGFFVLLVLFMIWRDLFAATVSPELARAEGKSPGRAEIIFMGLMAVTVAIAMKLVGALLITALLIIPAASARRFSAGPGQMAVIAAIIGVFSAVSGLYVSLSHDIPSGPAIVIAALCAFLLSLTPLSGMVSALLAAGNRRMAVKREQS